MLLVLAHLLFVSPSIVKAWIEVQEFENILEQANLPALSSAEQDMIFASYHLVDDRLDSTSSIYSGYPSVKTSARDTFISLPGLTLATGRESVAVRTLNLWIERARDNDWIMPEFISLDGKPIFEGMDDGLWFVYAADKYLTHIKDTKIGRASCRERV